MFVILIHLCITIIPQDCSVLADGDMLCTMLVICKILIIRIFSVLFFVMKKIIGKKGQFIVCVHCIAYYLGVALFIDYSPQFAQDQPQQLP